MLSIVVLTKNRYATRDVIVDQCLCRKSDEFELVIKDNRGKTADFAAVLE